MSSFERGLLTTPLLVALCFGLPALSGCQQGPKQPETFVKEYRTGDYQKAYDEAVERTKTASGTERDRAALMAGLSSHALKRPDEAQRWLTPLTDHADAEIAGTAGWTLGVIAAERGDQTRAASLASDAAGKLQGDDAARSAMVAGDAYARLKRNPEARAQYERGLAAATGDSTKVIIQSRLNSLGVATSTGPGPTDAPAPKPTAKPGTYVISLGAFANRGSAEKLVVSSRTATLKAGQPAPMLVTTTERKSGQPLFGVQVGEYPSRAAAQAALTRIGLKGSVLAAVR